MKAATVATSLVALLASACGTYRLPLPNDFTAALTLPVQGASGFNQKSMTVGDYQVAINRGSTDERTQGSGAVQDVRTRQNVSFVITRAGEVVFSGGCRQVRQETDVEVRGGVSVSARDKASLECEMLPQGKGSMSWTLRLEGSTDDPLNGTFTGSGVMYQVSGIGLAVGSTKHGPTGGYHIRMNDRTVAVVQTTNDRHASFAADAFNEALLAAAVALLL